MSKNRNLHHAKAAKKDEFYTQREDIDNELKHYKQHFVGKVVYCNCDDPRVSQFFEYFSSNFEFLGLNKLITTCYKNQHWDLFSTGDSERAIYLEYHGDRDGDLIVGDDEVTKNYLDGDGTYYGGDFRSSKCIEFLKQSDIVVTNPPFSLFREYVAQLIKHHKKFLIIGNKNAITYKEIFPLIRDNKLWVGYTPMGKDLLFDVPDDYAEYLIETKKKGSSYRIMDGVVKARSQSIWFTNLTHKKRNKKLLLYKRYSTEEYPHYDNYDAIEVSKVKNIPVDWAGVMGVPISFLEKYNPEQFEILGCNRGVNQDSLGVYGRGSLLGGKETFKRLFIRNKQVSK